jgi:hypothetical protein
MRLAKMVFDRVDQKSLEVFSLSCSSVSGGDLEVAESLLSAIVAGALAVAVLQPVDAVVGAPSAEDKGHASLEVFALDVITAAGDGVVAALLGELHSVRVESISSAMSKGDLGVERSAGVNLVATFTVSSLLLRLEVRSARATVIAPGVVTLVVRVGAVVDSSSPGVQVGLHHVELWAVETTNLVGIAVVEGVITAFGSIPVLGWHADKVEGVNTAAFGFGNIVVPFKSTAEEIWGVVANLVQFGLVGCSREISSVVHAQFHARSLNISREPAFGNVELVWLTVDGDIQGLPSSVGVAEAGCQKNRFEHLILIIIKTFGNFSQINLRAYQIILLCQFLT